MDHNATEDQARLKAWADRTSVDAFVSLYATQASETSSLRESELGVEAARLGPPSAASLSARPSFESGRDLLLDPSPFGDRSASTSWLANASSTSLAAAGTPPSMPDLPAPPLPRVAWAEAVTPLGRPVSLPRRVSDASSSYEDGPAAAEPPVPSPRTPVTPLGRPISINRIAAEHPRYGSPVPPLPSPVPQVAFAKPLGRPISLARARSASVVSSPGVDSTTPALPKPLAPAMVTPLGRPVSIGRVGNHDSFHEVSERGSGESLPPKYTAQPLHASPLGRTLVSSSDEPGESSHGLRPPPPFRYAGMRDSALATDLRMKQEDTRYVTDLPRPPPIAVPGRDSVSSTLSLDFSPGAAGAADPLRQTLSPILSAGEKSPISPSSNKSNGKIDEKSAWPAPSPTKTAVTTPAAPAAKPAAAAAAPPGKKKPDAKQSRWKEYIKTYKTFARIFTYSTKRDRFFIVSAVIGAICAGLTFPAMTIVFGNLVANVTTASPQDRGESIQEMMTGVIDQSVLYMVYLFAARFIFGYIATLGFNHMSLRVSSALRLAYLKALLGQRVSLLDTQPPGQIAAIITSTANTLQSGISEQLGMIIQSLALILAAMGNAFYHSWKLTLVTSSGLVLISICYFATTPFVVRNMKEVEEMNMKASAVASEALSSVRMVAACGAEAKMVRRYAGWVAESRKRGMAMSTVIGLQKATIFFSVMGTFALTFWFAVGMIKDGEIQNVSILIIVLMCVMMSTNTIGSLAAPLSAAGRAAGAASIMFNGIDAPKPKVTGFKGPEVSATERIVLWNVNFTYPTRPKQKVLDNLKLVIPAGKVTAIVGPSGSGKSTIVNLIERWYDLDGDKDKNKMIAFFRNGSIKIGGKNLHELDLKWWRSQIGLVQQEPFLFNDTIFKNVAHGLIGTEWEDAPEERKRELVEEACKEAYADEFISRLPDGYDTEVGDQGSKLSGGQRQRLAIARSIVKQPKILILDEATSAIDVRGEKVVQAALDKVSKNRTTIMIAHRLSTVKKADNIIVLAKGQVAQWGTHEQLMAKVGGPYWVLTNAQKLSMGDKEDENPDTLSEITEEETRTMDIMTHDNKKEEPEASKAAAVEEPKVKAKGMFRSFGVMFAEQKHFWPWYLILMFGAVIAGASSPVQAYLFAALLSCFSLPIAYLVPLTNFWCLMFVILACGVMVGYFALGFASTRIAFLITTHYQAEYFTNILRKPVSFFDGEGHSVGALTALIAMDPQQLQQLLGTNMAFALISVLSVVGCLTLAFFFGWKLTAVALSCAMPLAIAAGFFRIRVEKSFQKMNNRVFAESAKFATESIGAIRTVTALTLEDSICQRYETLLQEHVAKAFKKARVATIIFAASDSIPLLCMAFILWYGGGLLVSGEYWSFQYLVVYISVIQGAMGAGQWLSFAPNIAQATIAANRIRDMRVQEADIDHGMRLSQDSEIINDKEIKGVKIELQDVWFRYPTRDVPVLCGLDMTIEKGQFAAIVGPSGCGKTSIISLLERFYNVKSGGILYNGVNIEDIRLRDYRKTISLVAQEAFLFQGTIRDNILFGVEPNSVSDDDLHQACRDAEIHEFVMSLPDGYNTKVGFRGVLLSGGQKQRLSIARALIRDPRLLLLDEATSALDSETEKLVQGVFEKTKKTRTMVVVAHRLATIQNADIIFCLGDGNVIEQGTHAQLLALKGVYHSMCQAQALDR